MEEKTYKITLTVLGQYDIRYIEYIVAHSKPEALMQLNLERDNLIVINNQICFMNQLVDGKNIVAGN